MDTVDRTRKFVAIGSVILLIVVVLILGRLDLGKPIQYYNGDQLGRDTSESLEAYIARADESLEKAQEPAFALVAFENSLNPRVVGNLLEKAGVSRVNVAIPAGALPVELPEPTAGASRADVLTQQLQMQRAPELIDAVVVYDSGDELRELAGNEGVLSVEVAPVDAAWGLIGIRPVR